MSSQKANEQTVQTVDGKRRFPLFPAAIVVFIVDDDDRFLILSSPKREGLWEVVNGGLDANETLLQGALRETKEEAGEKVQVKPLGVFHASSFHYDENVKYMISICFLCHYIGGKVEPGDDMKGSRHQFLTLEKMKEQGLKLLVPGKHTWLFERALQSFHAWKSDDVILQPELLGPIRNKYAKAQNSELPEKAQ